MTMSLAGHVTSLVAILCCVRCVRLNHAGEADYTLDDSFWNEESPVGEVERLLREYRQNQELVRNIGAHYYQIIYPVQLRHHEKMGISTREIGASKVRYARSTFPQRSSFGEGAGGGAGNNYQGGTRGRSRTGKHFHRTSLLIKAFNHKFRLDLELNTQLLAPNIVQKHFLPSGAEQTSKQEIEHCYYHGTVKDYPGASAAFHTCNGVSGVIHVGNETFVIHPFYGGDLSKHPHVIFEARTKANKGCANSGNLEWRTKNRRGKNIGLTDDAQDVPNIHRHRRDVREATKYIETAMVIDKAMFDKRNGSTRAEVVHDAIQVANIADLYFRTLNTRVSVVYIETWQGSNQAAIDKSQDISRALLNFNDYTSRNLFKIDKDTTQLLTGETFQGGESGMAVPETVCTAKSVGISVDINTYEPHLLAGTMAHMIGHNIGMGHDDGRDECFCRDWHGCIMAQSIVGLENVQPYKFSECSRSDYIDALRIGHGICLLNKPNELEYRRTCGNGIVEEGEDCDCGTIDECHEQDPCCDPITCKLTKEAECASGPCCDNCKLRASGVVCREADNECDLSEHCNGEHGQCPVDVHKRNGNPCASSTGYCFNGVCPTLSLQCERIWGYGGIVADQKCFDQFNSKGSLNGHCGVDSTGHYMKCEPENVRCGSLQCQLGNRYPMIPGMDQQLVSRTIISIKGVEYECKATSGTPEPSEVPNMGLVRDGTPCGDNLICVNQTCVSIFPYIPDLGKCPSNHNSMECSGHGVCSNINKCFCDMGWSGSDCSLKQEVTHPPPTTWIPPTPPPGDKNNVEMKMEKKETPYGEGANNNLSTLTMVFILVAVVKGVFICFALMAVCYRRKSTMPKYDPPYVKKTMVKNYAAGDSNHHSQEDVSIDSVNKTLTFGNMPSYSRGDSQRVLFRPVNHTTGGGGGSSRFQEHKMQQIKRVAGIEDDSTHSVAEETVSFIDLQHNNLSKLPEKGILKKHGYGLVMGDGMGKDKWAEDSQSDNMEVLSQSDNVIGGDMIPGSGGITDVERTLKSLNGYHEDILEALRNAASHRGINATPSGSSSMLSEEILRKTLQDCGSSYGEYKRGSQEKICEPQTHTVIVEGPPGMMHHHRHEEEEDDDVPPSIGPIRIRNLEDLIRQLEHHSSRHMSPSGSEDIRMSETEADRHYRLDSSAACSESSQGSNQQLSQSQQPQKTATILPAYSSRCRARAPEEESRFVYGRYRQPTPNRHPPYHSHHHPPHHSMTEEEGLYETADHDRGDQVADRDTPDSESDEFIQAQQQLVRWASEDAMSVLVHPESVSGDLLPLPVPTTRKYFPSPPSTESESSLPKVPTTTRIPGRRGSCNDSDTSRDAPLISVPHIDNGPTVIPNKRYPEYKH